MKKKGDKVVPNCVKENLKEGNYKVEIDELPTMFVDAKSPGEVKQTLRRLLKKADSVSSVERVTDAEVKRHFRLKARGAEEVEEAKIPHALDPKKSLKHAMTDVGLDKDVDGDVDILDKMKNNPDEITGTEKNAKAIQSFRSKRAEIEKKHTKIGVAYEAVSPAQQAAIAIAKKESGDYDKEGKRKKSYKEMMDKATNREFGTDSLRKIYSDMTPGQTVKEAIEYHKINSLCLKENIFRPHSEQYYKFFCEARRLWEAGELQVDDPFDVMLLKSDAGLLGMYEGMEVPLDIPMIEEEDKKTPELNKPKAGGPKKYYVFVKDPSTGNIKKVSWGDTTGLKIKLNDPAARKSFAARHQCSTKTDKTKPGYWACRMPYYAKELGLSGGGSFFW